MTEPLNDITNTGVYGTGTTDEDAPETGITAGGTSGGFAMCSRSITLAGASRRCI